MGGAGGDTRMLTLSSCSSSSRQGCMVLLERFRRVVHPPAGCAPFFVASDSGMAVPPHTSRNWGGRLLPDPVLSEAAGEWILATGSCGGKPHCKTGFRS